MSSSSDKDSDHCETLLDVQSACRTAVEILNDLLCFDKLDSGILEVHKHEVPVIPFIADCVNMFASQAREAGVTIKNVTNHVELLPGKEMKGDMLAPPSAMTVTDLLSDDIVFMDKFKMDQVLRNLISNAVKFTPSGGFVTVFASFIPGNSEGDDDALQLIRSDVVDRAKGSFPCAVCFDSMSVLWSRLVALLNCCLRKKRVHVSVRLTPADIESVPSHLLHGYSGNQNDEISSGSLNHDDDSSHQREWEDGTSAAGGLINKSSSKNPCYSRDLTRNSPIQVGDSSQTLCESAQTVTGKLRIVVTDTGAGISEADQQRLFKEIVQFNPEVLQAGGGSGLGLWITSSIVQMHSGTIQAYSAGPNQGSTFTVEIEMQRRVLPSQPAQGHVHGCSAPQSINVVKSRSAKEAMGYSKILDYLERGKEDYPLAGKFCVNSSRSSRFQPMLDSKSFRVAAGDADDHHHDVYDILVVDDSGLNRKLLCKLLRASGHTCEEASDGLCAVEKVKARIARGVGGGASTYDAILMDFVMPNMDGPTATEVIRGLGYSRPIFGVTGNALCSDVNHFISHGANAVLAKPFDFLLFQCLMKEAKKSITS
jgi:signal transduction histidine kinase/CheY-like chemotaxis protein